MNGDLFGDAPRPRRSMGSHQSTASQTDVWLTPQWILAPLGHFDLDPCAPEVQPWPTAAVRYTEAQNGLIQPWRGRVWLNPPYSRPLFGHFMRRMVDHGRGTALIFARTETRDFVSNVWDAATGLLFLEGRVTFCRPDGAAAAGNAGAPSVLCAYGHDDAERLASSGLKGRFVPLLLPRIYAVATLEQTWREAVEAFVRSQPGPVRTDDLYRAFAGHPKTRDNRNWQAKLRQVMQRGPFERVDRGVWRLAT